MPGGHPFRAIAVDDLLEASSRKAALCMHINVGALARSLHIPRHTLADHLDRNPELRRRLRVVKSAGNSFKTPELYLLYEWAAKNITQNDDLPCGSNLAPAIGVTRPQVIRYMRTHHELATRIGFVSEIVARVWRTGKAMQKAGIEVKKKDLAKRAKVHYVTLVNRILPANPTFEAELGIGWDTRKWQQWNRTRRKRKK